MKFFKDELKKIRAFVFDVDGVLSHQSQNLTPDGELIRTSCTKDGYAIMYAIRKGISLPLFREVGHRAYANVWRN